MNDYIITILILSILVILLGIVVFLQQWLIIEQKNYITVFEKQLNEFKKEFFNIIKKDEKKNSNIRL